MIDVFPNDAPTPPDSPKNWNAGGYQMLVRGDTLRGKYRNSFSKPEPFVPNKVTEVPFALPDIFHTFKKGHRLMVHVQSSWFPIVDRNPQVFMMIKDAKPEDFKRATQRIFHSPQYLSRIEFIEIKLKSSENARKYILTGQVFDHKLNQYYGQWVESISDITSEEFYPFVKLMLCQKHYMNKKIYNALSAFNEVYEYSLKNSIHPILKGRVAAWDYILNNSEKTLNKVLAEHEDELSKIEILQFTSRLVWQYFDNTKFFHQFEKIKLSELNLTNTFYQKGRLDCYKLSKSYNYWLQKSGAYLSIIKQINPHYFHISDLNWLQAQYLQLVAL